MSPPMGFGLGRGSRVLGFSPSTPASAIAIWEGDKNVTIVAGPLVTAWTDTKSGIAATASGALRPTTATVNGVSCVSFGGSAALSVPTFALAGAKTIIIGVKMGIVPGAGNFETVCLFKDSGGSYTEFLLMNFGGYTNVTYNVDNVGAANGVGYSPTLDTISHDYAATWTGTGVSTPANFGMTLDAVTKTPIASGGFTSSGIGSIGGRLTAGLALSFPLTGNVMYVYVYNAVLSAPVLAQINAYNVAKWGI